MSQVKCSVWLVVFLAAAVGCGGGGDSAFDEDGGADEATDNGEWTEGLDIDGDIPEGVDADTDGLGDDGDIGDGDGDCPGVVDICDGLDNDCDGLTDEDFDLSTDMANCGECGATCDPPNAVGECVDGGCNIVSCIDGWVDVNGSAVDGCEYPCSATGPESRTDGTCTDDLDNDCDTRTDETDRDCADCVPELCNLDDDDCDGLTDEGFDTDFDVLNCGSCDNLCRGWPNASPTCVLGECYYECDEGWSDLDGLRWNGCEVPCVPSVDTTEVACNGTDDDCDGSTDEDYLGPSCGEGLCRRNGVCLHGTEIACVPRTPPVPTDTTCDRVDNDCDGATDEDGSCVCYSDPECDDGDVCNGVETCLIGVACQPGTAVHCDDYIACTSDRCNPLDGSCSHLPDGSACSDGNPCDGVERCDAASGCLEGTPTDCDDAIDCTIDTCNPLDGACQHAPNHGGCQDGVFCNGEELCDRATGCRAGPPATCDDGLLCTDDLCSAATDSCAAVPVDSRCNDGQFCTGVEQCAPGTGCLAGTPPVCDDGFSCTTDSCDPAAGGGSGACVNRRTGMGME